MKTYFSRLNELISLWIGQIEGDNKTGSTDINKYSEYIAKKLLDAAFSLNLDILPKNHPAVDLGDKATGISFQITSRTDKDKITDDLQTFKDRNLISVYRSGMRFFLLVMEKPKWQKDTKTEFNSILPGFAADRDIYTFPDIVEELKKNYLDNSVLFRELLDMMEWQFGNKTGVPPLAFSRIRLREGSRAYYHALRGPNGRFKNLVISDLILSHTRTDTRWIDTRAVISGPAVAAVRSDSDNSDTGEASAAVSDALPVLWKNKCKHAVIQGDGGMGKTVSLLKWWEQLLAPGDTGDSPNPIPVFIALNEFNQATEEDRKDFIITSIIKNYGGADAALTADALMKIMKGTAQPGSNVMPALVLLLDGFNEITVEKRQLLLELNRLAEQCAGLQIVMTGRIDMRGNFNWGHWNLVRLLPLTDEQVESYLGVVSPPTERLRLLVKNPMMLTLFAATCEVQKDHKGSNLCRFTERVETPGELLWNFIEAQVAKLPERLGQDESKIWVYTFLLRFLLPALGYEMEKAGLFYFSREQVQRVIHEWCVRFGAENFLETFPGLGEHRRKLPVGECKGDEDLRERAARLRDKFCRELCMLVEEGETLRFLHQVFRDFFAAMHVLREVEVGLQRGEIPAALWERRLDLFVRRLVGEIEGEHYNKPSLVVSEGWKINIKQNRLYRALELCRGQFSTQEPTKLSTSTYTVWNIVMTWKEVRGELSGADLSGLDLSGVVLNGVRCSRYYDRGGGRGHCYLGAVFDDSRVHEKNFFPQGHSSWVNSAVYSPNGKKILSASQDKTIKEWDAGTGECLQTLVGHASGVNSAVYSSDGEKILSVSSDNTIKEWDAGTGECLHTLIGHTSGVNSAVYSPDGKKILSASDDHTIKEWDAETGECLQTLRRHTNWVNSAVYGSDGEKILSSSRDHTIKEWDAGTGECLQTLTGHTSRVRSAVYCGDGKKILSASGDRTIKEWNAGTGECLQTLAGHTSFVRSAVYSPDGEKILSASNDHTIKEWEAGIGECLKTLTGHTNWVTCAVYCGDGKKILSASYDGTIKEWDAGTGECLQTLAGHTSFVRNAGYNSDGEKILSASDDHTIKEWDARTGECLQTLTGHTDWVNSAVYSSDGEKILSASDDHTIKEWGARTGACLQTLVGHTSYVNSAVYSPDGEKILSASDDHTIKEWNAGTGECLQTLTENAELVISAVYSKDGEKILSVTAYGTFTEWDAATGQCLKIHEEDDNPDLSEYPDVAANRELEIEYNAILVPAAPGKDEEMILPNIPGLWVQGCSFKNLEKGSQWTEEGLRILKQYGAIL